jgi:hypothetical protein
MADDDPRRLSIAPPDGSLIADRAAAHRDRAAAMGTGLPLMGTGLPLMGTGLPLIGTGLMTFPRVYNKCDL